jgi:hypothetical protein
MFQLFLLRPRTSKEWLAYQYWDAYHSLRNNTLDAGEDPCRKADIVFNADLMFPSKNIWYTNNKNVERPPEP